MTEQKLIRLEGDKIIISKSVSVDPNKDGQPVLELNLDVKIDILELPDEVYDLWMKKKGK